MAMSSERLPDWDVRLATAVDELVGRRFEWGVTDCGSICQRALEALYGDDHAGLPHWTGAKSAARAWRRLGGAAGARELLEASVVGLSFARSGDLALLPGRDPSGLPRLGVFNAGRLIAVHRQLGVLAAPPARIPARTTVWRLP